MPIRRLALLVVLLDGLLALAIAGRYAQLSQDWQGWSARRAAWELLHGNLAQQQREGALE